MKTASQIEEIRQSLESLEGDWLTIYCDVNPADPLNAGGIWRKRVKKALEDIAEINQRPEHAKSLAEQVLEAIEEERPEARTLALFASMNHLGKTRIERFDLKVDLPVVDLREGRVEARYGKPWLAPLMLAFDEYERCGVLHINGSKWHLFEFFLGEMEEIDDVFARVDDQDWKELREAAQFIRSGQLAATAKPDLSGSTVDSWADKARHWKRKLYTRLARLVEKTLDARGIERLAIMGEHVEASMLASLFHRRFQDRIVALESNPSDGNEIDLKALQQRAEKAFGQAERRAEHRLLDQIREMPGIWGLEKVIDAIQLGQVGIVVVPWRPHAKIWHCPEYGLYGGTREAAARYCAEPVEVPIGDHILDLAENYGVRIEFVEGETAERLDREFEGIAGCRRW